MIIQIYYKGDKDDGVGGERVYISYGYGVNRNTKNTLIRGWHLEGYSYSGKGKAEKVWRLFKASNIKSMIFTGNFFRMAPFQVTK